MSKPKFKIGQLVKCVINTNPRQNQENGNSGAGWIRDKKFLISKITNFGSYHEGNTIPIPIYWENPANLGGVYEDFLKLVDFEWNEEEN